MQNCLAVYTVKRAITGGRLAEIAQSVGIDLRFMALGGQIASNTEARETSRRWPANSMAACSPGVNSTATNLTMRKHACRIKQRKRSWMPRSPKNN